MSTWMHNTQHNTSTTEWFESLLEKSGFTPEEIWTNGSTQLIRAGGFIFRLGRTHVEATGEVLSGIRAVLMRLNANGLTDLYEDGQLVFFRSPEAIQSFRILVDQGESLTKQLRERMIQAYARVESGKKAESLTDPYSIPSRSIA